MVQSESNRIERLFLLFWLQFAFPDHDTVPAHLRQFPLFLFVALLVSPNLCHPELTIRLGNLAASGTFNRKL